MRPADAIVEVAGAALGHASEVSGTVVDAGEAAREWLGRRVVAPRLLPCGECDHCRRGRVALCPAQTTRGALAPTQAVPARWLTSVEPPLWPDGAELWQLAALADAVLTPYTALSRAGVGPSDTVVVLGNDARAVFARQLVAAKGAKLADRPVDGCVVLVTGSRALPELAPGVIVVLLDETSAHWPQLVANEAHVLGVLGGHPDLLPEICALVVRGQLALAPHLRRVTTAEAEAD